MAGQDGSGSPAPRVAAATSFSLSSGGVLALANLIETLLPLVRNVALTRLIAPDQVGLMFTLTIIITAIEVSADFGLPVYAVRKGNARPDAVAMRTLQTLALIRSAIIGTILLAISPLVAWLFHAPEATPAYALLALIAVLRGFDNLGIKEAMRDYVFWREAAVVAGSQSLAVGVTIIAAAIEPSFTCALAGLLAGSLASIVLSHVLSPRPYRLGWDAEVVREAVSFGSPLILNGMAVTLNLSDRLLIGAVLGPVPLAIYSVAYGSALLPRGMLSKFLTTLAVPIFVKAEEDGTSAGRLPDGWAIILSVIAFCCGLGLCLVGNELIRLIFGAAYSTSRLFMCVTGLNFYVKMMMLLPVPIAYQTGRTWLVTYGSLLSAATLLTGCASLFFTRSLETFLIVVTLTEAGGLLIYVRRALRVQSFSPLLSYLLVLVPAAPLALLCVVAAVAPDLPMTTWGAVCLAALAAAAAFYFSAASSYRLVPCQLVRGARGGTGTRHPERASD